MDEKFKVDKKKETLLYILGFIFTGVINVAFWIQLPQIIRDSVPGDAPFIFLAGLAAAGSLVGIIVHYLMFRDATR
jgi:hypothetical protein